MKPHTVVSLVLLAALTIPAAALAQDSASATRRRNFTAQQKPRVAVMKFENTNAEATQQGFGSSVSAMLITFLKRQSQLVVVERQNLDAVLDEWKKRETGVAATPTEVDPLSPVLDPTQAVPVPQPQQQLLASIEAILDGRVTVLGDSVEIDARLISPEDAHIIAAGHQSGPRTALRETVERLGIELEQGLLRPYYGNLTVTVDQPSNVRVFLTPILSVNASDDERPAVPLDRTLTPQARVVQYEKWVTVPNVANISSLLGGWYSVRLERPGFESVGIDSSRIVLQDSPGQQPRLAQVNGSPLTPDQQAFVVEITPFETRKWPMDARQVRLTKKGGSVALRVRREFLDSDYMDPATLTGLKTFVRAETRERRDGDNVTQLAMLEINDRSDLEVGGAADAARVTSGASLQIQARLDDIARCHPYEPGRVVFDSFNGGRLLVPDYHTLPAAARRLPVGSYRVWAVMPNYTVRTTSVFDVADKVEDRIVQVDLKRMTGSVTVFRSEPPSPGSNIVFEGEETKFRLVVPLDFTNSKRIDNLPVDTYIVTTDLPGFNQWRSTFDLISDANITTTLGSEPAKAEADLGACAIKEDKLPAALFAFDLKTQPWLAGRVERMNRFSDPSLSVRKDFSQMLDTFIAAEETRRPDPRRGNDTQSLLVSRASAVIEEDDQLEYLRWYLRQIDLLYLDDTDMQRLLKLPEAAKLVREYIDGGGAVYCFISQPGDFTSILGAPIALEPRKQFRKEVELRPGDVKQMTLDLKLEFQLQREFPVMKVDKAGTGPWRVVSYRKKGRKEPAILEKGDVATGGYVLVWLDALDQMPIHTVTDEALSSVEKRALMWAQYLMYRRLGPTSPQRTDAQSKLDTSFTARGEGKMLPQGTN